MKRYIDSIKGLNMRIKEDIGWFLVICFWIVGVVFLYNIVTFVEMLLSS